MFGDPAVRGQKIEEYAVADLVLRNNENRPGLISGAAPVAEERQEASSKNAIGEMAATITGVNNIGLWLSDIQKCGFIGKMKQLLFNIATKGYFQTMMFHNTEKKVVTEMHHKFHSSPELQRRSN